ncbi:MAG: hypothetical protein IT428_21045 [Planctomycetaceae bacterium]|nr:hypothetical protein [Planctomycetaceae bacterium]
MSTTLVPLSTLEVLVAALRAAEPTAFAVAPRVLRRVVRHEFELRGFWNRAPQLHSIAILRSRLQYLVEADELGIDDLNHLPPRVILVEQPEDSDFESLNVQQLGEMLHRRLLHAKVHAAYDELRETGRLSAADFRRRIHQLGQVEFDEAHAVLKQEHRLRPEADAPSVFIELAATWLELRHFEPHLVRVWFPSLYYNPVDKVLTNDIDGIELYETTRLRDLPSPSPAEVAAPSANAPPAPPAAPGFFRRFVSRRLRSSRLKRARHNANRGNDVRAAVLWRKTRPYAGPERAAQIETSIAEAVERLARRLQAALRFDDTDAAVWRQVIAGLAENSTRGFWNADARLLYDIQKVCLDHEREVSAVDLLGWITSFGKRPLKRPLPNQREVLMSKHLHSAARRVPAVMLPPDLRDKLSNLLEEAAKSAAQQLRGRLQPIVATSLQEVGLTPANIPERVAFRKIVEELIDNVIAHGFVTMADLRDAISRNNLKMPDLSGPMEFLTGDALLRADRRLATELDGVYRRGEIYLRWLQALSSAAFGTATGRFLVRYFAIPFGGAYIILAGLSHLLSAATEALFEKSLHLVHWNSVGAVGVSILLLIHAAQVRSLVTMVLRSFWRVTRGVLFDFPRWMLRHEWVRAVLRHPLTTTIRRWIIQPALFTGLAWLALPLLGFHRPGWLGTASMFLAFWLAGNSRTGRDIEELVAEQLEKTWHRIRIHVFVALFDLIMETFKRILDFIEKLLYEVDEFLRFRSGESVFSLVLKGVLGIVWAVVTFVVRFAVTLLIEPQVNPIKHFPVVTVSHKLILPFVVHLAATLETVMDKITARTLAGAIVTCIPGIFGFLVWEFRENWRLYGANRLKSLRPTLVGEHGETFVRLLKPGFHSGTVSKIYARRRRASRSEDPARRRQGDLAFSQRMQHVEQSIRRFLERELVVLLEESHSLSGPPLRIGIVEVDLNRVKIGLMREGEASARIQFLEQSGWLVAEVSEPGWTAHLPREERQRLENALAGLYRLAGVDLVREQIYSCFPKPTPPFDIADRGLVVWPGASYENEIVYPLLERPVIRPRPRYLAESWSLPRFEAPLLLFRENPLPWDAWVRLWSEPESQPLIVASPTHLLPTAPMLPT